MTRVTGISRRKEPRGVLVDIAGQVEIRFRQLLRRMATSDSDDSLLVLTVVASSD